MRSAFAVALVCLWVAVSSPRLPAAVAFPDPVSLAPLESRMLADPTDGEFRRFSLIEAALVASGVERGDELDRYAEKYAVWLEQTRRNCRREKSQLRQAEALFEFMHRQILVGGYDARATELTQTFDEGKFNCASASLLFTALATDCGLTVHAVERPRHAMCALYIDGQRTVIETTCPNWFQLSPDMRRDAERAVVARTNVPGRPTAAREISPAELVAVIYYNRGVDLLQEMRYAAAVSVNLRALRLDPKNATAFGNLLASINNWSLALCEAGDCAEAAELLARGLTVAPDHESFHANQRHVYRTWIQSLATAGRQSEAVAVLAAARQAEPDSPLWNVWSVRLSR
jgi:tetratricopeptide (TPR) repeat protein